MQRALKVSDIKDHIVYKSFDGSIKVRVYLVFIFQSNFGKLLWSVWLWHLCCGKDKLAGFLIPLPQLCNPTTCTKIIGLIVQ